MKEFVGFVCGLLIMSEMDIGPMEWSDSLKQLGEPPAASFSRVTVIHCCVLY